MLEIVSIVLLSLTLLGSIFGYGFGGFIYIFVILAIILILIARNSHRGDITKGDSFGPTNDQHKTHNIFTNLWMVWFVSTLSYTVLVSTSSVGSLVGYLAGLIGLFVPVGPWSTFMLVAGVGDGKVYLLLVPVLLLLLIFTLNRVISRLSISNSSKILLNFLVLFLLTLATDLAIYQAYMSWGILLKGGLKVNISG